MNIIQDIPPVISKNAFVSLDIELFEAEKKILHRPTTGRFAALSICSDDDPETVYVVTKETDIPLVMSKVRDAIWAMHNAKFDLTHLRRWSHIPPRNKVWCTMIMERIMWGGYFDNFGLDHLVRRYLDIKLDKSLQSAFETATELTPELLEYSALDAYYTLPVAHAQRKQMRKEDLKIWQEVDRPAMWAVMDFKGFRLDVDGWIALAERNEKRVEEIDARLDFNPRSWQQTKPLLKSKGFKKLPNTRKETLEKWTKKFPNTEAAKLAEKILESKNYSTMKSRYGYNFIDGYLEDDLVHQCKVIHCNYWITGAETGRMSASDPAMHQVPSRNTKEFRECFIARDGHVLIIVDYSQQEPCITAYLSGDKEFTEIINSEKDIYIESAWKIFGERVTKEDKRRKEMKSLVLGTDYGMTPYGLAEKEDLTLEEAENLIDKFFNVFRGVGSWITEQRKKKNYVETVLGRKAWLNRYSDQCERNALNSPIQGTAADITKMALGEIHRRWKFPFDFCVVGVVHDEIILDAPKNSAEEVAHFVKNTMIKVAESVCPGIKFRADAVIGTNWAAKE